MKKMGLILLSTLFVFLLAEFVVRAYYFYRMGSGQIILVRNKKLLYEHKPDIYFTNNYGIKVRYNSLGFIGAEPLPKAPGVLRILGIGDSVTAATYLPEEQRYLNRAVSILKNKTGKELELINAGVGGYNTSQEFELIKEKGLLLEPDIIIIGVCLNDFYGSRPAVTQGWLGRVQENHRDGSKARYFDFLYQKIDLYKFVYDIFSGFKRMGINHKDYQRYLREYRFDIGPGDFEKWRAVFSDIVSYLLVYNIKPLFVVFPLENQVYGSQESSYTPLTDFFREAGVNFIDLLGDFKAVAAQQELLFMRRDMIHPASLGHEITAEAIVDYIIKERILQDARFRKDGKGNNR